MTRGRWKPQYPAPAFLGLCGVRALGPPATLPFNKLFQKKEMAGPDNAEL